MFSNKMQSNIPLGTLIVECKMRRKSIKSGGFRMRSVVKKVLFCCCLEDPCFYEPSFPYTRNEIIEKDDIPIDVKLHSEGQNDQYYICAIALPIVDGSFSFVDCNITYDCVMAETNKHGKYNNFRTEYRDVGCRIAKRTRNASWGFNFKLDSIVVHHSNSQYQITHSTSSPIVKKMDSYEAVNDPLSKDLLQLYKQNILSDVTINTEGKSFMAHTIILSARSPVFRAMFENDELSDDRSWVVDSETVDRMLVFLYGDSLQGLQWGEAARLNYAADKYDVQPLKQKCADILKAGLTVDNVCDALVLADKQSDEHLRKWTVDFIYDQQEVVLSPQFEKLENIKPRLTSKVTKALFLKSGRPLKS